MATDGAIMIFDIMQFLPPGTLVAVTGVDPNTVRRIARVVVDQGATVTVETDNVIEGDAAVEHDFPTPEPATLDVPRERLRLIQEDR